MMALLYGVLATHFWHRVELLSWPLRLIWAGLVLGLFVNGFAAFLPNVEPRWKRMYVWLATICALSSIYFILGLAGVIQNVGLISLLRWVFPLYAFSMCLSALMHIFEWKAVNDEIKHKADAAKVGS